MTVAWVFPGQGSQKIGMAKQIEILPNTKQRFSYASEIFERNLFEICELNTESTNPLMDLNQLMLLGIVWEKSLHYIVRMFFHSKIVLL